MLSTLLKPLRRRRALKALRAYSEAKDAYRRAVVRGDTRRMHETLAVLNAAMIARLRAEVALGSLVHSREAALIPTEGQSPPCSRGVAS